MIIHSAHQRSPDSRSTQSREGADPSTRFARSGQVDWRSRPPHQAHRVPAGKLRRRAVEHHARIGFEAERPHVAGDSDDRERLVAEAAHDDRAAKRIFIGEVPGRDGGADDRQRKSYH